MGTMRFRVFPAERITAEMVQQAYLSGIDRVSWPVRASVEGDELILQRSVSDSANLHVPWRVEGHGLLTLASASLIERPEPYLLPLELARGTVVQVRNQLSEWQVIGLAVPEAVHAKLATAVERLSWASVEQGDAAVSAGHAEESLRAALDAANLLAAAYAEQAIVVRRRNEGTHFGLLAGDLGTTLLDDYTSRQFLRSFNAAELPICWRDTETTEGHMTWVVNDKQVEWCRKHGLKILAGPLLLLDPQSLPDWLLLFEDDFESVLECVSAFIGAAVERYRGKVDYWICAGRVNAAEVLALSEHERLQLVVRSRRADPFVGSRHAGAGVVRSAVGRIHAATALRFSSAAICRRLGSSGARSGRADDGDQRRLPARRHVAAPPAGVQPAIGRLGQAGAAVVAVALGARAPTMTTLWRSERRRCRPAVGPRWRSSDGRRGSCRWRWPSRRCEASFGTSFATASRTISRTPACSTPIARPSPPCARWPRSARRT